MLFALTGGVAMLYDRGLRTELLDVVKTVNSVAKNPGDSDFDSNNDESGDSTNAAASTNGRRSATSPLPAPSADGVIVLRAAMDRSNRRESHLRET